MLREDAKKKLNMTGEVKYESRCNLDFFQKVTKCRLLFLSKSDLRIFEKPGETKILTDGTVAEISFCPAGVQRAEPFVQGMQRGGSSMLGLRGKAHYRVKGETPCPVI